MTAEDKPTPDLPRAPSGARSITAADKKNTRYNTDAHPVLRFPTWVGDLLWFDAVPQTRILPGMVLYGQLCDLTNHSRLHTFASAQYLADRQRVSVRTIWRCIDDLTKLALIEPSSQGRGEVTHVRVLCHPRQHDYSSGWMRRCSDQWGWTDLVDYAMRGHGDPTTWSDEVHDTAQAARVALRPIAHLIDVEDVARRLDRALRDVQAPISGIRKSGIRNVPTPQESDRLHALLMEVVAELANPEDFEAMFLDPAK